MTAKKISALLALTFWGGIALTPVAHAETLQDAVQQMIATNPDILAVGHNRQARDEEVRQAQAGYYPTLNFEAGKGKDYVQEPFDGDLNPQQIVIGARQNIFAGLSTTNEVGRQKARVKSEAYVVQSTTENTSLKTVNVYLEVLKNEAIVKLAQENLTLHQRIADQIKLRSESGIDRGADMDQIQSRVNLAQSNVIVTEQNLSDSQTNYSALVGHPPLALSRPAVSAELIPASLEKAEQMALADHPQLKSADADLEARRKQDEVAKSPFMPILDLEIDKVYEEDVSFDSYYDNEKREDLRVFLRLRYNLFNGWRDEARKSETVQLISEAREIKNHTHRQVVESIRLSWQAHEAAKKKINYLQQRAQFAAATASAYTKQWNIGQRTLLDVLDAEAERIDAARQLVTAEYENLYSQYRILNSTGKLLAALQLNMPKAGAVDEGGVSPPAKAEQNQKS